MPDLQLTFASGETSLSVRRFAVHEGFSVPFQADVWARSPEASLDLGAFVGKPASFRIEAGFSHVGGRIRVYSGIVSYMEQARSETSSKGLSTYRLSIVPKLWFLNYRQGYRVYQHLTIPAIVDKLLAEWGIVPDWRIDQGRHPELEYKVQYEETDLVFLGRLLEESGITLFFDDSDGTESKLVLSDAPHQGKTREGPALPYVDNPTQAAEREFATHVALAREVRPGAMAIRDVDFRRPSYGLRGEVKRGSPGEDVYESYEYRPGAFLTEPGQGGDTPTADDRGVARHDEKFGKARTERALLAERAGNVAVTFDTNALDLRPGTVFSIDGHAHPEIDGKGLLVTGFTIQGSYGDEWHMSGDAVSSETPYLPPIVTARPAALGVQTATVVGPAGEEIHTDEFGRVRVQFPWDREGKNDEQSSCWMRVNEGWGGRGYGMITIPRIGQEVLVGFLEGDPDRPLIVGRVYNQTQPVVNKLPDNKTQSDYKSNSSPKSEGYNEIKYEDKATDELVYWQAQKNQRALVKNDDTHTVGHDRDKHVGNDEIDTTDHDRFEVTGHDRREETSNDRMTFIRNDRKKLIKNDERERTSQNQELRVGRDQDILGAGNRRERVREDSHLHVMGSRRERIEGSTSLTILENQYEDVKGNHALSAGGEIHLSAMETMIGEAADATIKGPGGFIRIDGAGIHIVGNVVDINVSGSPGDGAGSDPELPDEPNPPRPEAAEQGEEAQ